MTKKNLNLETYYLDRLQIHLKAEPPHNILLVKYTGSNLAKQVVLCCLKKDLQIE
jgi:hypothetical protein